MTKRPSRQIKDEVLGRFLAPQVIVKMLSVCTLLHISFVPVLSGLKADAAPVVSKPLVSTHCPPSRSCLAVRYFISKIWPVVCVWGAGWGGAGEVLCFSDAQCESTVRSPTHSWVRSRPAGHNGKEVHLLGVSADPLSF